MPAVIHALDSADDAALAEAHAVFVTAESHGRPRSDAMNYAEFAANLRTPDDASPWRGWGVLEGARLVGVAMLTWPTLDNLHQCSGTVSVLPAYRRRGHGSALLVTLVDAVRELGRSVLEIESIEPYGVDGAPSGAFLRARGLVPTMHEERSELRLAMPVGRLDQLSARVPPGLPYAIETWRDVAPERRAAALRTLLGRVEIESPHGERDVEPETWTEQRLRQAEQRRLASGRTTWTAAAFTPSGECAGFTELLSRREDDTAHQAGTLVARAHRGHRLGLAVKLANLRALRADRPDLTSVTTYTAPENAYMHNVNDALGFTPIETLDVWSLYLG